MMKLALLLAAINFLYLLNNHGCHAFHSPTSSAKQLPLTPAFGSTTCLRVLPTNYQVSLEILEGLQSTSSDKGTAGNTCRLLDLQTDFYDKSTGLYSEGVWHNCMAGIAALQLSRLSGDPQQQQRHYDDAARIAESLFKYSWDDTSFRRRAWSGNWDHSELSKPDNNIEQANYYEESSEHRCIQHGIALVFWSLLAECSGGRNDESRYRAIRDQHSLILEQFVNEYWNGQRWTPISKSQGSGTSLRPSASSGTAKGVLPEPYFRAADQAIAVLACVQTLQFWESTDSSSFSKDEGERIAHIIQTTCTDLLNEDDGFGYDNFPNAKTYLGIARNRNFWHEGWVMLALASAMDDTTLPKWDGLVDQYTVNGSGKESDGDAGTIWNHPLDIGKESDSAAGAIWHWPLSQKNIESNVRYCGDNVLAYAIRRKLRCKSLGSSQEAVMDEEDSQFWGFVNMLRSKDNARNLASVADVYTQVRLHPNTELAALLVWP